MSLHSTGNDESVWRQMLEYLDGTLPDDEVRALNGRIKADEKLRATFVDLLIQQIKLKELAEERIAAAEEAAVELEPTPANVVHLPEPALFFDERAPLQDTAKSAHTKYVGFPKAASVLAAAAVLILSGVLLWLGMRPARVARVASLEGHVAVERKGERFTVEPGAILYQGDRIETEPQSHAVLAYLGEATEVTMSATSLLQLDLTPAGKRLQLDRGSVEASVARQPVGKPMKLTTEQAEAVVVGTRFKLATSGAATRLEVFEGAVRISSGSDAPGLLVPSGNGVTVIPGHPVGLKRLAGTRGSILLEQWDAGDGPTNQTYLTQFMFSGVGVKPGSSRVRGYLHPPRPGAYSFHVEGGGDAELWLSDSDLPEHAVRIWPAADGGIAPAVATLRSGERYYIELRQSVRDAAEAFTLSWTIPGGQRRVIYGDYLSPYDTGAHSDGP